jgi:SAM-dependent methyltransferase
MQDLLLGGIPKERNYRLLIESDKYKRIETFSNSFLSSNKDFLENYSKRWVKDPLHQWSRQWEYPYVFNRVESVVQSNATTKILDAGSGITFFPYYLKSLHPFTDICCVDNDKTLENIYQEINAHSKDKVNFSCSDLEELPYAQNWFDVVYCISVLEHTDAYAEIIEEFHKVLRPGGRLVITFDISLDGIRDVSIEKGTKLLRTITEKFKSVEDIRLELTSEVSEPDIFTTHSAKAIDPNLLPWKFPQFMYRINSIIRGHRLGTWPPSLTVFCLNVEKRFDQ